MSQILTCQYRHQGCHQIATHQHFVKLNFRKLDKGYICANCKAIIQKK